MGVRIRILEVIHRRSPRIVAGETIPSTRTVCIFASTRYPRQKCNFVTSLGYDVHIEIARPLLFPFCPRPRLRSCPWNDDTFPVINVSTLSETEIFFPSFSFSFLSFFSLVLLSLSLVTTSPFFFILATSLFHDTFVNREIETRTARRSALQRTMLQGTNAITSNFYAWNIRIL